MLNFELDSRTLEKIDSVGLSQFMVVWKALLDDDYFLMTSNWYIDCLKTLGLGRRGKV